MQRELFRGGGICEFHTVNTMVFVRSDFCCETWKLSPRGSPESCVSCFWEPLGTIIGAIGEYFVIFWDFGGVLEGKCTNL